MSTKIIVPDFNYTGMYYPEILEDLIKYMRVNCPEITDESDEEPFIQLLRAFALTAHLNNVLLDMVAKERFLPTAALRRSVAAHLALIGYQLKQASPASVDIIAQLSQLFTATTQIVPVGARVSTTDAGADAPSISFESLTALFVDRTDQLAEVTTVLNGASTGADHTSDANSPSGTWDPSWNAHPSPGDCLYIGHSSAMFDQVKIVLANPAPIASLSGVWEYYAGDWEEGSPDSVATAGVNLVFMVDGILGTSADRSGTEMRVTCLSTGASYNAIVYRDGLHNYIMAAGYLGQSTVSTRPADYMIGRLWREVAGLVDPAQGLAAAAGAYTIMYTLPQTQGSNWRKNGTTPMYHLRFRILTSDEMSGARPVLGPISLVSGATYIIQQFVQGSSEGDNPLGSSTGLPDQQFQFSMYPVVDDANLKVFVTEGGWEDEWVRVNDFLDSGPNESHFTIEFDDDGRASVIFGNGVNGRIPEAGSNNIRSQYRVIQELNGNVGPNTVTVNQAGVAFINRLWNPRTAAGWKIREGTTPEDLARVKMAGPASLRVLDRALGASDIEALAVGFQASDGSRPVARAVVIESAYGPKTAELVCVGAGGSTPTLSQMSELYTYFNGNPIMKTKGKLVLNSQLLVSPYQQKVIDITATVYGGNLVSINSALTALLSPMAVDDDGTYLWGFGAEIPLDQIRRAILDSSPKPRRAVFALPSTEVVQLLDRELPVLGTVNIIVLP